jgi:hypothetical protein
MTAPRSACSLHTSRVLRDSRSSSGSHHEDEEHYPTEGESRWSCVLWSLQLATLILKHIHLLLSSPHVTGFSAPIWRNTLLFVVAFTGIYRFSTVHGEASPARSSSSGHSAPGNESEDGTNTDDNRPFLTRYMDYYSTPASVWKERNERHLDLVREKAEEKLLFQDAERPPVHRFRYAK